MITKIFKIRMINHIHSWFGKSKRDRRKSQICFRKRKEATLSQLNRSRGEGQRRSLHPILAHCAASARFWMFSSELYWVGGGLLGPYAFRGNALMRQPLEMRSLKKLAWNIEMLAINDGDFLLPIPRKNPHRIEGKKWNQSLKGPPWNQVTTQSHTNNPNRR